MKAKKDVEMLKVTPEQWKKFKKLYERSVLEGKEQFVFMGRDVLTSYAKYLIQYVDKK